MEKVHILGLMEIFMMENGCKALKMALEYLKVLKTNLTLVNGKIIHVGVMELINGQMEINMKENGFKA